MSTHSVRGKTLESRREMVLASPFAFEDQKMIGGPIPCVSYTRPSFLLTIGQLVLEWKSQWL